MSRKVIITVALTGGLHDKAANPNLPEQPGEIAASAAASFDEGAAIAHIHARDPEGRATADSSVYREIHDLIRDRCNIVIQDTTGGGPNLTVDERIQAVVEAGPEMASLNMGTLVRTRAAGEYRNTVFRNTTDDIEAFARALLAKGIKPEMEVYAHAMFREVENLIEKELVRPPFLVNLVLGMAHQGAEPAEVRTLLSMIEFLPPRSLFNVCAVGRAQLPLTTLSALLGGNIRVGLEDNFYLGPGDMAQGNGPLVEKAARMTRDASREPATVEEARAILQVRNI